MNDFENELPTRPDTPNAAARRCKRCGLVYGSHAEMFPLSIDAECLGLRENFEPEDSSDDDATR
jgi:hypothetical protein